MNGDVVTVQRHIPVDHPAFVGHFPGRPLLPGAMLLAEVIEAIHQVPAIAAALGHAPTLNAAKFLAPVAPGSELVVALQGDRGGLNFEVRCGAVAVARGRFEGGAAP